MTSGRADLSSRIDLRRRNRRRGRLRMVAIGIAVAAVLIGLGYLVFGSTVLETREVQVEGSQIATAEQVIEAAQVPIGTPLARIPAAAIKQRVLALPSVQDVSLKRVWPNTLVIQVTERTLAYQRLAGGAYQWVDAEGRIFHSTPDRVEGALVANTATDDPRLLADVATVVAALPPDVAAITEQLSTASIDNIVVTLTDGRLIVWGNASQSAEKAALLPVLLAQPGNVYDISVPSHPAIR